MTKRIAGVPPLLLAAAGFLTALPAAGQTQTPHDVCRSEPPAGRKACLAAADLLASRPRRVDLAVYVTARADSLRYRLEPVGPYGIGGCQTAGTLVLPVARRVKLIVTSDDAIYAWRVAALGVAVDLIPGRINVIELDRDRAGPATARGVLRNEASGRETEIKVRVLGDDGGFDLRGLCGG